MRRTRIAHVIFPRTDPLRPVLGFVWDAVQALASTRDLDVEPILPLPIRPARGPSSRIRKLRGRRAWPHDIEARLLALEPRPTIVPYVPVPLRSIESAALAIGAQLALRPKAGRPMLLHGSFLDEGGFAAAAAAEILGCASIAVAHGSDVRAAHGEENDNGRKRRALFTIQKASKLVAVSHHLGDRIARLGGQAEVLRYSTTAERFPLSVEAAAGKKVLFVGRVSRDKGVDLLLEAVARLPDVELMLVGPRMPDLNPEAEAARLGISARVRMFGELPQDELGAVYAQAAMTVLPSRHEGFGIVLVESLLTGRPVIGADIGGIREIISPEVGALTPPEDPQALAAAISEVLGRTFSAPRLRALALGMTWDVHGPSLAALTRSLIL